jgi:hypothetical protein
MENFSCLFLLLNLEIKLLFRREGKMFYDIYIKIFPYMGNIYYVSTSHMLT